MSTIPSPRLDRYQRGDMALVRCEEVDPFEGWPQFAEDNAHDLRCIRVGDELVAVFGYFAKSPTEVDAFALIDRAACRGVGRQVARIIRQQQSQWMQDIGLLKAWAHCSSNDRAAQVFLRAIGYRRIAGPLANTTYFLMTRSA